jgi:hypothetical protein
MDNIDRIALGLMIGGLSFAMLLICHVVKSLQQDVDLLRVTAAVPEIERHA